jgi:hypothetical protein
MTVSQGSKENLSKNEYKVDIKKHEKNKNPKKKKKKFYFFIIDIK